VAAAYSRFELERVAPGDDPLKTQVRLSYRADRCGDVFVVPPPFSTYMKRDEKEGTYNATHGTPHDYDTHVPLLVFGAGVTAGIRHEATTPLTVAPILAHALGIRPPPRCTAYVSVGLFAPFAD
jgi:hypothetical protein